MGHGEKSEKYKCEACSSRIDVIPPAQDIYPVQPKKVFAELSDFVVTLGIENDD